MCLHFSLGPHVTDGGGPGYLCHSVALFVGLAFKIKFKLPIVLKTNLNLKIKCDSLRQFMFLNILKITSKAAN